MNRQMVISVAVMLACAAGVGLWLGRNADAPRETDIIEAQALRYAAETGRPLTDCAARPGASEAVRLVVTCGSGWVAAVDSYGRIVEDPALNEPQT